MQTYSDQTLTAGIESVQVPQQKAAKPTVVRQSAPQLRGQPPMLATN